MYSSKIYSHQTYTSVVGLSSGVYLQKSMKVINVYVVSFLAFYINLFALTAVPMNYNRAKCFAVENSRSACYDV